MPDKINTSGIEPQPNWWVVENSGEYVPYEYIVVDVIGRVSEWIESQPVTEWKYGADHMLNIFMARYVISQRLFTLLALKWPK